MNYWAHDDMRVLQVLVAAAGPSGRWLEPEPETEFKAKLGTLLERRGILNQTALYMEKRQPWLLREIGLTDGGNNLKALRESLRRMAAVTTIVKRGRLEGFCRILSYAVREESGALVIALNPRIAHAVVTGRRYTRIEMSEVRALKGDPARLIHQRLCGWIDPGSSGRVEVNTLVGYVWPEAASIEATKKRRQAARRALGEIAGVGWRITQYARGKYEIWRQKAGSS